MDYYPSLLLLLSWHEHCAVALIGLMFEENKKYSGVPAMTQKPKRDDLPCFLITPPFCCSISSGFSYIFITARILACYVWSEARKLNEAKASSSKNAFEIIAHINKLIYEIFQVHLAVETGFHVWKCMLNENFSIHHSNQWKWKKHQLMLSAPFDGLLNARKIKLIFFFLQW